jgi:hypothetical protein
MTVIWNANRKGHADNLLDAAMTDAVFHEKSSRIGWLILPN